MNNCNIQIGKSNLLWIIDEVATFYVNTEFGLMVYKKDGNINLN